MRGEIDDVEIAWLFSPTVRRVDNNQASDQLERGTIRMILWQILQILFIAFLVGGFGILALYSFWLALQDSIVGGRQARKDRRSTVELSVKQQPGGGVQIDEVHH